MVLVFVDPLFGTATVRVDGSCVIPIINLLSGVNIFGYSLSSYLSK